MHTCSDECDPGNCQIQHAIEFGYDADLANRIKWGELNLEDYHTC